LKKKSFANWINFENFLEGIVLKGEEGRGLGSVFGDIIKNQLENCFKNNKVGFEVSK